MASEESDSFDDEDFGEIATALSHFSLNPDADNPTNRFLSLSKNEALSFIQNQSLKLVTQSLNSPHIPSDIDTAYILYKMSCYNPEKLTGELLREYRSSLSSTAPKPQTEFLCGICRDLVRPSPDLPGQPCGHDFCAECWRGYVRNSVNTKGLKNAVLHCPQFSCERIIPVGFVRFLFASTGDASVIEKYTKFCTDHFAFHSDAAMCCLEPSCDFYIVQNPQYRKKDAFDSFGQCRCGFRFCFDCKMEDHSPALCKDMKTWLENLDADSSSANYVLVNTKSCPKCESRIEKNKGCNHMACFSCEFEFCWVCSQGWDTHGVDTGGFYKCNIYRKQKLNGVCPKNESSVSTRKARHLFYLTRYQSHRQSLKFAQRNLAEIEHKMAKMFHSVGRDASYSDFEYLRDALLVVKECRKVLQYSYVFVCYCPDSTERELFEFLQQDLEKNTELLHGYVESASGSYIKEIIVQQTALVKNVSTNLLKGARRVG